MNTTIYLAQGFKFISVLYRFISILWIYSDSDRKQSNKYTPLGFHISLTIILSFNIRGTSPHTSFSNF